MGTPQPGSVNRVPPDEYGANLRRMVQMSRDAGAVPVFLLLAAAEDIDDIDAPSTSGAFREQMRLVAEEMDVPLADAEAQFKSLPRLDGLFEDAVHPGKVGAGFLSLLLDGTVPR
jgi:lysophospholipase L1-like esterase